MILTNKIARLVYIGLAAATLASASELDLGTAGQYALVVLGGSGSSTALNSGPINGSALVGDGITFQMSGGNNGAITGGLYYDSTATVSGMLQTPATESLVNQNVTYMGSDSALAYATSVSNYAAGLTATQTLGTLNGGSTTITGNGGLNVIDISSVHNAGITISGNSSDVFVINITGSFQQNVSMTLNGVAASQILWNFTGSGNNLIQTSGAGTTLDGTFLSVNGASCACDGATFNGAIIIGNTSGGNQFVSGFNLNYQPFGTPSPEPVTATLAGAGLLAIAFTVRRSRLHS